MLEGRQHVVVRDRRRRSPSLAGLQPSDDGRAARVAAAVRRRLPRPAERRPGSAEASAHAPRRRRPARRRARCTIQYPSVPCVCRPSTYTVASGSHVPATATGRPTSSRGKAVVGPEDGVERLGCLVGEAVPVSCAVVLPGVRPATGRGGPPRSPRPRAARCSSSIGGRVRTRSTDGGCSAPVMPSSVRAALSPGQALVRPWSAQLVDVEQQPDAVLDERLAADLQGPLQVGVEEAHQRAEQAGGDQRAGPLGGARRQLAADHRR